MKVSRGFSLIEVAVVLVILGLLLGAGMVPIAIQMENAERKETKATMQQVRDAMLGYLMANGRLPCPDIDEDGEENRTADSATVCDKTSTADFSGTEYMHGRLPFKDLGIRGTDTWGRVFYYQVAKSFTESGIVLTTAGDIEVWPKLVADAEDASCESECYSFTTTAPFIVISEGKQQSRGGGMESENIPNDSDNVFIDHDFSSVDDNPFDDLVLWVSSHELIKRLVDVGKLP